MKKLYFIIALFAVGILLFTITAQKSAQSPASKFKPGWFIGANGGMNWYMAEGNDFLFENTNKLVFFKNIGSQGVVNLGYNFTPVYALKGGLEFNNYFYATESVTGSSTRNPLKSQKLNFDMMVNLTNLNKGFDPDRKLTLSAFGGMGVGYYSKNTNNNSKIGGALRAGLQGDYNLTQQLALNLIVDGNLLTDNSNDAVIGLPIDVTAGLLAGLTYRFVEKKKPRIVADGFEPEVIIKPITKPIEPEVVPQPSVVVPEKPQVAVVDTPKQVVPVVKPVIKPEVKPEVKPEPIAVVPSTKENLFFKFNSLVVETASQEENLARLADYLKKNPQAKVVVSGYADNASGTDAINDEVSKQRAINVANNLINKYGVDQNRLMVKWFGSKVQPFTETWKNRVVILNTAEGEQLKEFKGFNDGISAIVNEAATKVEISFAVENAQVITEKQRVALTRISNYLKQNPQAKVFVNGYASNSSGTDEYNDGISKKRAITVANLLIKDYGIDFNRIKVSWFGGRVQPYKVAVMNQLVIVKAE
jgi:outer membrane protein OmpA-like peptidoglycan-associated protein/opacity protein-like surface antigen